MSAGRLMRTEMAEQPDILAALARRRVEVIDQMRSVLPDRPAGIVLLARGSSDNAAVYGRYVLEHAARRPVALAAPSLHTLYGVETAALRAQQLAAALALHLGIDPDAPFGLRKVTLTI